MKTSVTVSTIIISLVLLTSGVGCVALSHYITPANIDKNAVKYVEDAGVGGSSDYGGYPNLAKAERLQGDVDSAHSVIQFDLQQKMEKDSMDYSIHRNTTLANLAKAQYREESLFGEAGLLSLGLSLAGFGTFTGVLGLMRKRPGDITSTEMEQTIGQVMDESDEELSTKEKQFIQVVTGIQDFITANDGTVSVEDLKTACDNAQDADTKAAVTAVKSLS